MAMKGHEESRRPVDPLVSGCWGFIKFYPTEMYFADCTKQGKIADGCMVFHGFLGESQLVGGDWNHGIL